MKRSCYQRVFLTGIYFTLFASQSLWSQFSIDLCTGNTSSLHQIVEGSNISSNLNSYSLNLSYVPKKIGIGIQISTSTIQTNQDYLDQFETFQLKESFTQDSWENRFLFLGPVFKLSKNKFNLELFPKIGIGQLTNPNREIFLQQGQEEYLLYQDNSEQSDKLQFFSGLDTKLNIGISKNISTHISAGINTNRFIGDGNSTIYREVPNGSDFSPEEVIEGRLLQLDCESHNLITIGIGLTFTFPQKEKNRSNEEEDVLPPINSYPEADTRLTIAEADSLVFEWHPESKKLKGTNYVLSLYKIIDDKDSLIFTKKTKEEAEFDHTDEAFLDMGKYKWIVHAVDGQGIDKCKEGCFSRETEFEVGGVDFPQFYHLQVRNQSNYIIVKDKFRFVIEREYFQENNKLQFKVFDSQRNVVMTNEDEPLGTRYGENTFELNPSCCLNCNEVYDIEVTNTKNEKRYQKFLIQNNKEFSPCHSFKSNEKSN